MCGSCPKDEQFFAKPNPSSQFKKVVRALREPPTFVIALVSLLGVPGGHHTFASTPTLPPNPNVDILHPNMDTSHPNVDTPTHPSNWAPGYDDRSYAIRRFRLRRPSSYDFVRVSAWLETICAKTMSGLLSYNDHPVMTTTLLNKNFKLIFFKNLKYIGLRRPLSYDDPPVTTTTMLKEN